MGVGLDKTGKQHIRTQIDQYGIGQLPLTVGLITHGLDPSVDPNTHRADHRLRRIHREDARSNENARAIDGQRGTPGQTKTPLQ